MERATQLYAVIRSVRIAPRENTMWVFGYGSLMCDGWEARFGCVERSTAKINGYRRTLNKKSVRNWGTAARPGLTLNLREESGSSCTGVAFNFASARAAEVLGYLREREGPGFVAQDVVATLTTGATASALAFVYGGPNLVPSMPNEAVARQVLGGARGTDGTAVEYLAKVISELEVAGVEDSLLIEIWRLVQNLRAQAQ
jgi:cation transport protein ChaC